MGQALAARETAWFHSSIDARDRLMRSKLSVRDPAPGTGIPSRAEEGQLLRPRVLQLTMDRGKAGLLIVQAPPGSGKSVLLSQLATELKHSGRRVLRLHNGSPMSARAVEFEVDNTYLLVDGIDEGRTSASQLCSWITSVLRQRARVVIALRGAGLASELHSQFAGTASYLEAAELSFTATEISDLLHVEEHGSIVPELLRSTEGWPLALQIVGGEHSGDALTRYPGAISDMAMQRIYRYFDLLLPSLITHEELAELAALRDLHVLAPEFLGALAPNRRYEDLLHRLAQRGFFIVEKLVPARQFQMHRLFRRYLQLRFASQPAAAAGAEQAALLLSQHGHIRAALQFAAGTSAPSLMARVLDALGGLRVPLSIGHDAAPYFYNAPLDDCLPYPSVLLGRIYCAIQQGRVGYARDLFATFNARGLFEGPPKIHLARRLLELILRFYENDSISLEELDRLQSDHTSALGDDDLSQAIVYQIRASVFYRSGDNRQAYANARRVFEISATLDAPFFNQYAKFYLALTQIRLGTLNTAEALLKSAIAASEQEFGSHNPQASQARVLLARIYVERMQFEAATVLIEENSVAADLHVTWRDAQQSYLTTLAFLHLHRQGLLPTLDALSEREQALASTGLHDSACKMRLLRAQLLLAHGKSEQALADLASLDVTVTAGGVDGLTQDTDVLKRLLDARVAVECGNAADLDRQISGLELEVQRTGDVFMTLSLLALVTRRDFLRGRHGEAAQSLARLIEMASRFGLYASLAVEWSCLAPVLTEQLKSRLTAQELATIERVQTLGRPREVEDRSLSYPDLGRRERQVLVYLALGMSSKEMAKKLDISVGTVKGYRRTLYEKLGVFRRSEAVAIARALNTPHTSEPEGRS